MSNRHQLVSDLFVEICDLPPDERSAVLDQRCGEDADLRAEVESLLHEHDEPVILAETAAHPDIRDAIEGARERAHAETHDTLAPGTKVGPYRTVEIVGEGGFGVVYLAEQEHPVRRRVALKVLKRGMDSAQILARFASEQRTLALMDHPGIARILDAGSMEDGRPFVAMEYVDGSPLLNYCDEHRLTLRERLVLFDHICHAVFHAHQKGVIHRDLKPSNVLVTIIDGKSIPKIIDFGIAKAVASEGDAVTFLTTEHQLVGTPQYMSPEQAANSLDLDTRTDIYSLGVLLYELLTGMTPFDREAMRKAGLAGMGAFLRDTDPPRPSTRLREPTDTSLGKTTIAIAAEARKTDAPSLRRMVRGDLDWIVMKALERDRERRYDTADAFAGDIRLYLEGRPVSASPPSAVYRTRKFVRRHWVAVSASIVIALGVVVGVAGAIWGAVHAQAERDRVQAISDFMYTMMGEAHPGRAGADVRLLDVLLNAAEKTSEHFVDDPPAEIEARLQIGEVLQTQSLHRDARLVMEPAYELAHEYYGSDADPTLQLGYRLLRAISHVGKSDEIEELGAAILPLLNKHFGPTHFFTIDTRRICADLPSRRGRFAEAAEALRPVLADAERHFGPDHSATLSAAGNLASALSKTGFKADSDEAVALMGTVLERIERTLGPKDFRVFTAMQGLARLHFRRGEYDTAVGMNEVLLERSKGILDDMHWVRTDAMLDLAECYLLRNEPTRAADLAVEGIELIRQVRGDTHMVTLSQMDRILPIMYHAGRFAEGESYTLLVREGFSLGGSDHPYKIMYSALLSRFVLKQGRIDEAQSIIEEAADRVSRLDDAPHATAQVRRAMGEYLIERERFDEARAELQVALAACIEAREKRPPPPLIPTLELLIMLSERAGDAVAAAEYRAQIEAFGGS